MIFSCRRMYSQRASSRTSILFRLGIAKKSNVSKLFTTGNRASRIRRSTARCSRSSSFSSPRPVPARVIDTLAGTGLGELVVFPQDRRQAQLFEVMREQDLRCGGGGAHAAASAISSTL